MLSVLMRGSKEVFCGIEERARKTREDFDDSLPSVEAGGRIVTCEPQRLHTTLRGSAGLKAFSPI